MRQLQQKKYRNEQRLFVAEGPKIVNEILNSKYITKEIFATEEFITHMPVAILHKINEKELEQISALSTPNQVLGVFEIPSSLVPRPSSLVPHPSSLVPHPSSLAPHPSSLSSSLVLAFDDIRDPGNFGTLIRIADWFGIKHILCSKSCVDMYNPKVIQASMGSIARVDVHYVNLENELKNFSPVYGAVLNGKNIYSETLSDKGAILIGNESKGISQIL